MSQRIEKINKLVGKHISDIILRHLSLKKGVFVTVAKVDTTADLRYTRVFVSIYPDKETDYACKTLSKELYEIQGMLNRKLNMRPLPRIEFKIDKTELQAEKIDKLLKNISDR